MIWLSIILIFIIVGLIIFIHFQVILTDDLQTENKVLRNLIEDIKTKF